MFERSHAAFQLGKWLIEPDSNRISGSEADGERQIEPRTMAVLAYLYQHKGKVVHTDEIIAQIWGSRPMGDNPLYKVITKLRRALDDDPNSPTFIITVSKKGYQLLDPDTPLPVAEDKRMESVFPLKYLSRPFMRVGFSVVVGLILGVLITTSVIWKPESTQITVTPMSTFSGSHSQPSFAPDGERFAFVGEHDGQSNIWVLDPNSANAKQITQGNDIDWRPRWSPDGKSILFVRNNNLWVVPATGGEAKEIIRNAYHPNWSHDGMTIVFERDYEVWTARADGTQQAPLIGLAQNTMRLSPRWPAFSPDDSHIVYFDSGETPLGDLWTIQVLGGKPEQLTFSPAFGGAPVWSADNTIYYSSQRGGARTLWKVDVKTKNSTALLIGSGDDDFPDVNADGKKLLYSNSRKHFVLVSTDIATGEERELFSSRLPLLGPELSPDKKTILFFGEARSIGYQLYTLPITGGMPQMITNDARAIHAMPRWGEDGKSIYYFLTTKTSSFSKTDILGSPATVVVDGWNWYVANGARLDYQQKRIVYSQLSSQAPVQTSIRDLETGEDSTFYETLEYPRWSKDGSNILGSLSHNQEFPGDIAICPVMGNECKIIAENARIPLWSEDETLVYFVRGFGKGQKLFVVSVDGGIEKQLISMAPLFPLGPNYDIAKDNKVIWVRYEEEISEIWMAEL